MQMQSVFEFDQDGGHVVAAVGVRGISTVADVLIEEGFQALGTVGGL
jgi:hypothetical protein